MEREEYLVQMKAVIIDEMQSPIVMFDKDDKLQMYNRAAGELLRVQEGVLLNDFIQDTNLRYILTPERRHMGQTKEFHMATHTCGKAFLIHGKEQWDSEGRYEGVFLVYDDITDQENMKEEATYYASHDKLTGLWNRDYFFEIVAKMLHENPDEEFLMIASDIAQFKLYNEILGMRAGNELLLNIANNFRKVRKKGWVFSRMTGDRFALFMPSSDFEEEQFLEFFDKVFEDDKYTLHIHNYIGIYSTRMCDEKIDPEAMYNRAYLALESIKGDLRRRVAYFDEKMRIRRMAERLTIDELERALQCDEFVIYIQPQVDSVNGRVIGGETLVRWQSPKRGMVMPSEFVPLFEKNGMIIKMDYHVWELACRQLAKWKQEGHGDRCLSVNISAKNFYLTDLYARITGLVEKYGVEPQRLKLEITETAFVLDVKQQMELVKRLQDYGFLVEMDDFGSGYSSLNSLKDISIDILKLDMKFFERSVNKSRSQKIVTSMVELANRLETPVIAEGVENQEQIDFLQNIGCRVVQGYFYSKPMSVEEYEKFMETRESEDIRDLIKELREKETDEWEF